MTSIPGEGPLRRESFARSHDGNRRLENLTTKRGWGSPGGEGGEEASGKGVR